MDMDNVKDNVKETWEKIKKGLKDGAVLSVDKIEEYTKIGKLKVDELSAKRKIERNFLDIGERYFDLAQDARVKDADGDIVIKKAIDNIRSLTTEIAEIGEKIKEVQKAAAAKRQKGDSAQDNDGENSGV